LVYRKEIAQEPPTPGSIYAKKLNYKILTKTDLSIGRPDLKKAVSIFEVGRGLKMVKKDDFSFPTVLLIVEQLLAKTEQ
jgi:hypothetical protein